MADDPPGRLMRKAGTEERHVYYAGMDDSKDADFAASDSEVSESSAASSAASLKEEKLREEQQAAENVRSPTFFLRCDFRTYVRTYIRRGRCAGV